MVNMREKDPEAYKRMLAEQNRRSAGGDRVGETPHQEKPAKLKRASNDRAFSTGWSVVKGMMDSINQRMQPQDERYCSKCSQIKPQYAAQAGLGCLKMPETQLSGTQCAGCGAKTRKHCKCEVKSPMVDYDEVKRLQRISMQKSNDRAFHTGWSIAKKSWDDLDDDKGWTDNVYQCRNCHHEMTPQQWEQKKCPECNTRNTVHPSMR